MSAMEVFDNLGSVCAVVGGFPSVISIAVALPLDQILELTSVEATVEDVFDLVFFFVVNHDWVWWWGLVEAIVAPRAEPVYVNNRINFEPRRQLEAIIEFADACKNFEGSKLSDAKFWTGLVNFYVLGCEPDKIASLEDVGLFLVTFVLFFHASLGEA